MTAKCTYRHAHEPRCSRIATHNVIGSGRTDDWHIVTLSSYTPVFCEADAKAVAEHLNERWRQARALLPQVRKRSKTKLRCRVCDEVLTDGGHDVPEVGRCCVGCVTLAQGEMVQDAQAAGAPKKKRGRRVAAVIG
jgi:hypothetical protein